MPRVSQRTPKGFACIMKPDLIIRKNYGGQRVKKGKSPPSIPQRTKPNI